MRFPWSRSTLAETTVPSNWAEQQLWAEWEAPRNYIAGEQSYAAALASLAGPTCDGGYCFPAAVELIREPANPYDPNAIRAEVRGLRIGYLRRHLAEQIAPPLDRARVPSFAVCGLIRGGSTTAPNLGCHVWLDRRVSPGPAIELPASDPEWEVPWPPREVRS
jgi:hypothetical protein